MGGTKGIAVLLCALLLSACSSGDDESGDASESETTTTSLAITGSIEVGSLESPERCDPLDPRHCLLPFPSDTFTVADDATETGRRIAFDRASMPVNKDGVAVDPTEWNRNDGFSPGQAISLHVPGLDIDASEIPSLTDIEASLADDAPIVLLDATTGDRHPYFAELDQTVTTDDARGALHPPRGELSGRAPHGGRVARVARRGWEHHRTDVASVRRLPRPPRHRSRSRRGAA